MSQEWVDIALRMLTAWLAGSLIGLERSYHGRPAGFRTHAIVCVASALLMLVTAYEWDWLPRGIPVETLRTDPTRMAQGIMTGIGFLGAGVIFKEGLSVRGLTTAASIWITAALGILFGVGFYYPAVLATVMTLITLAFFRFIERRMPIQYHAHHVIRFAKDRTMPEDRVRDLIERHNFSISNMSYRLSDGGSVFEYRMVIRTAAKQNLRGLTEALKAMDDVFEFSITPAGD